MSNSNEKYILNGKYVNIKLENSFALTESLSGVQTPIITNSDSDKIQNEIRNFIVSSLLSLTVKLSSMVYQYLLYFSQYAIFGV